MQKLNHLWIVSEFSSYNSEVLASFIISTNSQGLILLTSSSTSPTQLCFVKVLMAKNVYLDWVHPSNPGQSSHLKVHNLN